MLTTSRETCAVRPGSQRGCGAGGSRRERAWSKRAREHDRPVTSEEVNDAFRDEAVGDCYRGIPGVADAPVVSADVISDPRASVVDAGMTRVVDGTLVKVMSWYDNGWGFPVR